MAIYMKIDGIDGHVTAKGHEKWIELSSFQWDVLRKVSGETSPGNVANREANKPTVNPLQFSKPLDQTTPNIFKNICVGKAIKKVELHVCKTDDNLSPYMEYTFDNVLVTKYAIETKQGVDGNGQPSGVPMPHENIGLSFTKVEMKYTPHDAEHKAQSPIPVSYDLTTATAA
jgi:type VI secretion system secreted protein Hcp